MTYTNIYPNYKRLRFFIIKSYYVFGKMIEDLKSNLSRTYRVEDIHGLHYINN